MNSDDRALQVASWSARHSKLVIACWLVAVLAGLIGWRSADHLLSSGASIQTEIESRTGSTLIDRRFDDASTTTTRVICAPAGSHVVLSEASGEPALSAGAVDIAGCYEAKWAAASDAGPGDAAPVWRDDTGLTTDPVPIEVRDADDPRRSVIRLLLPADIGNSAMERTEGDEIDQRVRDAARDDVLRAEMLAVPLTLIVLFLTIRNPFSTFIPLIVGGAAVAVAIGLTALAARGWSMSIYVINMIVMLGLAVGIDYTLLHFERYREERRAGVPLTQAIDVASAGAGRAVLASGATVLIALAGMLFVPISVIRDMAIGSMLVVLLGVVAVLTFLPALLGALGERVRVHRSDRSSEEAHREHRGLWHRWSLLATHHPMVFGIPVFLALGTLAAVATQFQGGISHLSSSVAESDAPETSTYWEQELTMTAMSLVEVVIDGSKGDTVDEGVERLVGDIGRDGDFAPVVTLQTNAAGDLTVVRALVVRPSSSVSAADAVDRLRTEMVPVAFPEVSTRVYVSGPLAMQWDVMDIIQSWQPRIIGFVLGMSFIALAVVFRSVVVPLVATLLTLLSVSAAIGVLVLVVQRGVGASLLGVTPVESIEAWVPIVLFSILFGLSMDYHVFLVSRIREQYLQDGDAAGSIAFGIQSTGRVICAAAAIMGIVFACFAGGRLVLLQQLGLGLAVAVLIDAFLVRLLLVPAIMSILGDWNWYCPTLPGWLSWRTATPLQSEQVSTPTAPHRRS